MNAHAKLLKEHPVFSRLSSRALDRLTEHAALVEVPKGSTVISEGQQCDAFYVVLSGRCQSTTIMSDGAEQIIDIYAPGDTFGERALLSRDRFWTTVKVTTDCVLLRVSAEDAYNLLAKSPKLEKTLERIMHGQLRTFRRERTLDRLGRAATFASISESARGRIIAHNVAIALRQETGRSVLYVEFVKGRNHPALREWERVKDSYFNDMRNEGRVVKGESGVWEMRIHVEGLEQEAEYVAPLIGHLSKHARYLVCHMSSEVDGNVVSEFLIQSDLSYCLMNQDSDDIYRANLLFRKMRGRPAGEITEVLPLICLEYGERAYSYESLAKQLGVPIHGFIHELPGDARQTHSHYFHHTKGRFSSHIRHIAREIGRCRIGLALSAGGAKGLAHIGVIQVLEENNIEVDVVAGTSMGGLIGSLWSHGNTGKELEDVTRQFKSKWSVLKLFDPAFPPRRGFIRGRNISRIVRETIGDAHFSDMKRQLRVVATDLNTLERVLFDCGEVAPIIHASMAMPGVVVPVTLNGRTLVDGGVADPLPVDVLLEMGVEKIIAVNTIARPEQMKSHYQMKRERRANASRRRRSGPLRILNHYMNYFAGGNILDIWMKSMHGAETRIAEGACKQADVVLRPVACDGKWHDFGSAERYIALGRKAAEDNLREILELVK